MAEFIFEGVEKRFQDAEPECPSKIRRRVNMEKESFAGKDPEKPFFTGSLKSRDHLRIARERRPFFFSRAVFHTARRQSVALMEEVIPLPRRPAQG